MPWNEALPAIGDGWAGVGYDPKTEGLATLIKAKDLDGDLSQMWLCAGELMSGKANDQLAQANGQLTTFFQVKTLANTPPTRWELVL